MFFVKVMDIDGPKDADKVPDFSSPQVFMYTAQRFI